jgi:hypothetical protein
VTSAWNVEDDIHIFDLQKTELLRKVPVRGRLYRQSAHGSTTQFGCDDRRSTVHTRCTVHSLPSLCHSASVCVCDRARTDRRVRHRFCSVETGLPGQTYARSAEKHHCYETLPFLGALIVAQSHTVEFWASLRLFFLSCMWTLLASRDIRSICTKQ